MTDHRCHIFQFSPPGSFDIGYRCTECGRPRTPPAWTATDNNAEERAARIPVGHM